VSLAAAALLVLATTSSVHTRFPPEWMGFSSLAATSTAAAAVVLPVLATASSMCTIVSSELMRLFPLAATSSAAVCKTAAFTDAAAVNAAGAEASR